MMTDPIIVTRTRRQLPAADLRGWPSPINQNGARGCASALQVALRLDHHPAAEVNGVYRRCAGEQNAQPRFTMTCGCVGASLAPPPSLGS
jgi:hypothetical protein